MTDSGVCCRTAIDRDEASQMKLTPFGPLSGPPAAQTERRASARALVVAAITMLGIFATMRQGSAQEPGLPQDVAAFVAHHEACMMIQATGWEDEQPWAERGCYSLGQEEKDIRQHYPSDEHILGLLKGHFPPVAIDFRRLRNQATQAAKANGPLWPSLILDWHGVNAAAAPAAVAVLNTEIALSVPPHNAVLITHDGIRKTNPIFSRNGEKIAFFEDIDHDAGIARIIVIDRSGHELSRTDVRPPDRFIPQPLMAIDKPAKPVEWESIARAQWLDDDRLVLQSSLGEYPPRAFIILNAMTGEILKNFVDTGSHAMFSPDGHHYYYRSDMPLGFICTCPPLIFEGRRLTLSTDEGDIFAEDKKYLELQIGPVWASDSQTLFILVEKVNEYVVDPNRPSQVLAWSHGTSTYLDGYLTGTPQKMFQANGDLFVITASGEGATYKTHVWKYPESRLPVVPVDARWLAGSIDWARRHRRWLEAKLKEASPDASMPDFWCASCDLAALPRASPPLTDYE